MNNTDKILREKENNIPLNKSNMEDHWAALEKQLLSSNAETTKVNKGILKRIYKPLLALVAAIIICIFAFKYFNTKPIIKAESAITQSTSAIKPPIPKLKVPYEIFRYDAALGDTIFTNNGSILVFPKNAVLYADGNIATGIIEIQTREFNDPLDYSLAGIPMTYDSAGVTYTFVSSGMIDIKAYQNGALLKVNPNAKPQLNLVSTNSEKNTNLYVLDTTTGQWINKGKDEVNDIVVNTKHSVANNTSTVVREKIISDSNSPKPKEEIITTITRPLPPQKASGKNPTIEIIIDPASFKELLAYNNLKFEVLNSATETVGEDSKTEWSDVQLLHTNGSKKYIAKFSTGTKSVQYEVKPVLEGKDYDEAINVYNAKIKAYYDLQKNRITNEQNQKDTIALRDKSIDEENKKTIANNEIVIEKNKLIDTENKRIEELNVLINARNVEIIKAKKIYQALLVELEKNITNANIAKQERQRRNDSINSLIAEKFYRAALLKDNLLRSFTIDGFGYWNCDNPTLSNGIPISVNFVNDKNVVLDFNYLNVATLGVNRMNVYYNNNITVIPNTNHIIWAIQDNQFYYLSYKEYEKLHIKIDTRSCTFKLNKYEGPSNSIMELKKILFGG